MLQNSAHLWHVFDPRHYSRFQVLDEVINRHYLQAQAQSNISLRDRSDRTATPTPICTMEPLNRRGTRLPWTDSDIQLLRKLHVQMPHLRVSELTQVYNEKNPQRQRTIIALRAKLNVLT